MIYASCVIGGLITGAIVAFLILATAKPRLPW